MRCGWAFPSSNRSAVKTSAGNVKAATEQELRGVRDDVCKT